MYPFVIYAVIFCNCDDASIAAGIWFILAGLLIRAWANGYAIKTEKLTTSGPYAFIRHPLYFGTMLILVGFIIMLKAYYAGVVFFMIAAAVYYRTVSGEEAQLEEKFRDAYVRYKKRVPAIFPTVFTYREGEKWPFSLERLIRSKEHKMFIWAIVIAICFYLKYKLIIGRGTIDAKILALMITALVLALIDLSAELLNKWRKT